MCSYVFAIVCTIVDLLYLDDENRIILAPCGGFKDDYINASPLDVRSFRFICFVHACITQLVYSL